MRLLHTADLHFGYENYGRPDPETGLSSRLLDFQRVWEWIVDYAAEDPGDRVDLFVIAGDLFRVKTPKPHEIMRILPGLKRLEEAGIETVIIPGNHDLPAAGEGIAHVLAAYPWKHLHFSTRPEILTLAGIQVATLPAVSKSMFVASEAGKETSGDAAAINQSISDQLMGIVADLAARLKPGIPSVLVSHYSVDNAVMGDRAAILAAEPILSIADLAGRFDYVALGHIHQAQELAPCGVHPGVAYSGSPERIDFGEEDDRKGFWDIELAPGHTGPTSLEFVETPARPFQTLRFAASGNMPDEDWYRENVKFGAVVRVVIEGTAEQCKAIDPGAIAKCILAAGASFMAGVTFETTGAVIRARDTEMTAELSILESLGRYLNKHQEIADRAAIEAKAAEIEAALAEAGAGGKEAVA